MKQRIPCLISILLLLLFCILAIQQQPKIYYPIVTIDVQDPNGNLTLSFLFEKRPTQGSCETLIGRVSRVMLEKCPTCSVRQPLCLNSITTEQQAFLSESPLSTPSGRMLNGVVLFNSADPDLALAACQMTERQATTEDAPVKCFPANSLRHNDLRDNISVPFYYPLLIVFAAFASAWLTIWLILKYEHLHAHLSHDHIDAGPQKYHEFPTPRIGGLAIMTGLLVAGSILLFTDTPLIAREFGLLLLASTPAFLGGLIEDLTKRVGVLERLLLTMLAGSLAAWLLGAVLHRLDIHAIDAVLAWLPMAVVFTIFAVGGIANATNIIDGYNGLAGGFAIFVLGGLTYVGYQTGDDLIFLSSLGLMGSMLGFLVWNWPAGKIFMGDGGAYLLGFILAELSVLLVVRNPTVSPWFPLTLLIYPVFETIFSIYRRKIREGLSPGQPDNRHLHQLIHDHLVERDTQTGTRATRLVENSRVAKYFWTASAFTAFIGCTFWSSTPTLMLCAIGFCFIYIASYQFLARSGLRINSNQN